MDTATSTLEQRVAETVLEKTFEVKVGEKTYQVAPPSTATLILVSEAISLLPTVSLDGEKVVEEVLSVAKDCRALGDIAAILILGAKNLTEEKTVYQTETKKFLGFIPVDFYCEKTVKVDRKAEVAREILENLSPRDLNALITQILMRMNVSDFFGLTTFLTELNLLHQKKVVEN